MKYKLFILNALLLLTICAKSQRANFQWYQGNCEYNGIFDSTKYSRDQLENIVNFLYPHDYISTESTAWKLEDISNLSIDTLDIECQFLSNQLRNNFIETPFWQNMREELLNEIEITCFLKKITILAYSNPDTLNSFITNDSVSNYYRNALINGGQQMLNAWIELNEIQKRNNADPDKVQEEFISQFNSPQRFEYARLNLMMFGWWNSANNTIKQVDKTKEFEKEFKKLFIKLKRQCDELE